MNSSSKSLENSLGGLNSFSAFSCVTTLAAQRTLHAAFAWLHGNQQKLFALQTELIAIPAPPFGEAARSAWMTDRFREAGLSAVHTDDLGNVFGVWPAHHLPPESTGPILLVSAHLDTVFPVDTPLTPFVEDDKIEAPGATDNAAGVIGLLAIAYALVHAQLPVSAPVVFMANVGEEGEGDLRGVRHLYQQNSLASRVVTHIVLDGAGSEAAVSHALGSRRFSITVTGPGGHSFTDAGTPNPIAALAAVLVRLSQIEMSAEARTTLNIGTIHGGTSVNSIPESATATVDLRSTSMEQLLLLEVELHRVVEDSLYGSNCAAQAAAQMIGRVKARTSLTFRIDKIGDRPAAQLPDESPLLETLRSVDRHLGLRTDLRIGSTDANLPLSLGIPAISLGAGGEGGNAHTRAEWYCAKDREIGLRRILLLVVAIAEWAASQ